MSWDLILFIAPSTFRSSKDIPKGYSPPVIGEKIDVVKRLEHLLPGLDFSKGWGNYGTESYALTLDLISPGNEEAMINAIGAQIHGGEPGVEVLLKICHEFHCALFDFGSSMRIDDPKDAERIFSEWKDYRDQVIGKRTGDQEIE